MSLHYPPKPACLQAVKWRKRVYRNAGLCFLWCLPAHLPTAVLLFGPPITRPGSGAFVGDPVSCLCPGGRDLCQGEWPGKAETSLLKLFYHCWGAQQGPQPCERQPWVHGPCRRCSPKPSRETPLCWRALLGHLAPREQTTSQQRLRDSCLAPVFLKSTIFVSPEA